MHSNLGASSQRIAGVYIGEKCYGRTRALGARRQSSILCSPTKIMLLYPLVHSTSCFWKLVHKCDSSPGKIKVRGYPSILCSMCRTSKDREDHFSGLFYRLTRTIRVFRGI